MTAAHLQAMTARQRIQAAIAGQPVDRVARAAWIHFGSEHLSPEQTAALHLSFAEVYQPDLLKINADYRLSVSAAHDLRNADDVLKIGLEAAGSPCFVLQKQCISAVLASNLKDNMVMDTVLSPFQNLIRNIGADQLSMLIKHQSETLATLAQITEATCEHLYWLQKQGVNICFFATHAAIAAEQYSGPAHDRHDEIVARWIQPFDKQVLTAASGMTRILHAHGSGLILENLCDYDFEVLHVATELPGNPSLSVLREWTHKCLMGGINETMFTGLSLGALKARIEAAETAAGSGGLILAPGCSLPSHTPGRLLKEFFHATNSKCSTVGNGS